jgi:2-polyprenyl-3-methyl-5-hydroxy-6-metoxy-1,4-benzoquinol methylase
MPSEFNVPAEVYDAMVDWPRRLANETPFYLWAFERVGAKRVLDAACGTGHHAAMFADWGMEAAGADVSAEMISLAQKRHGQKAKWAVRSYSERPDEEFDVVVCTGNSLPLAGSLEAAEEAVHAMAGAVRPGGMLVLHALNLGSREEGVVIWDKCMWAELEGKRRLLLKGTHRSGGFGHVELLLVDAGEKPVLQSRSPWFLWLKAEQVAQWCREAGCGTVEVYGSWRREAFDVAKSTDLIVVATK